MATEAVNQDTRVQAPTHPQYDEVVGELVKVRDCIDGAYKIKSRKYVYLPHPSEVDTKSAEQRARYRKYLAGAEFDNYPDLTRRSLLGKMRIGDTQLELPDRVDYLEQNCDGDGMPLKSCIEKTASSVTMFKYHLLVADYQGMSDVDLSSVSLADAETMNPRAAIKHYSRDNIVNWHFSRVNGVMQISYLTLLDRGTEFDQSTGEHEAVESYLILALDDEGNYYQQKVVYKDTTRMEGEINYLTVNGGFLKWIPVVFVSDEQMPTGSLPKSLGVLTPICDAVLARYNVSADHKETQRNLAPTTYTMGWTAGDVEVFKEANQGRDYIMTGPSAVNNLPADVSVDIKSASAEMEDFHWYFDWNEKKIRSLGGMTDDKAGAMTATEAELNAANQSSMLESIADNVEHGIKRIISYCAMFEGLWAPEETENRLDDITVAMPRDFATPKLTVEEVRTLIELRMGGTISQKEMHRQLNNGGWMTEDIDIIVQEMMDEGGPMPSSFEPQPVAANNEGGA